MATTSINTRFLPLYKPIKDFKPSFIPISHTPKFFTKSKHVLGAGSGFVMAVSKEQDVISVQSDDFTDHQVGSLVSEIERESEGRLSFESGFSSATSSSGGGEIVNGENLDKLMDRAINATIVLAVGTFGITKLLTIDYDYWHFSNC